MTPIHRADGRAALAILLLTLAAGCATQEDIARQDTHLTQRIDALEQRMNDALRAEQQARQREIEAREARQVAERREREQAAAGTDASALDARLAQERAQLAAAIGDAQQSTLTQARQEADALARQHAEAARREAQTHAGARADAMRAAHTARLDALANQIEEVRRMAEEALEALGLGPRKILGNVIRSATLTDDKTLFPLNSPELGADDRAKLADIAAFVKALDANFHIAIHGHTDGFGSDDYNFELGKARAEVVKRHLNEQHGIPLLRMSVISHGATGAGTRYVEGGNRRIVVEVMQ